MHSPAARRSLASALALAQVLSTANTTGFWALLSNSLSKAVVGTKLLDFGTGECGVAHSEAKGGGPDDIEAAAIGARLRAKLLNDCNTASTNPNRLSFTKMWWQKNLCSLALLCRITTTNERQKFLDTNIAQCRLD